MDLVYDTGYHSQRNRTTGSFHIQETYTVTHSDITQIGLSL